MPLAEGMVGPETKYTLEFKDGKLIMGIHYDGTQADASLVIGLEAEMFLDMLAEAIPGKLDNAVFNVIKAAMKA